MGGGMGCGPFAQDVGEGHGGGQWRAQLVAHHGQKVAAVAVLLGELLVGLFQGAALFFQFGIGPVQLLGALGHQLF